MNPGYPKKICTIKADFQDYMASNATTQFLKQTYSSATSHIAILFFFFYLRKEHSNNLKKPQKHKPKNTAKKTKNKNRKPSKKQNNNKKKHNQKTKLKQPTQDYKKPNNVF